MKRTIAPLPLTVILSMAGALGVAGAAMGQAPASPPGGPSEASKPAAQPTPTAVTEQTRKLALLQRGPTIDLDFRGGTFNAFLKAVQDAAAPTPVNVMTSAEAGAQEAPAIRLTGVTVDTALKSIGKVLEARRWFVEVRSMAQLGDEVPTFFLQALPPFPPTTGKSDTSPQQGPDRVELRVFSVRDLIEPPPGMSGAGLSMPLATVTSALALLQEQSAVKGPPPDVKLHEESGTLLVRGNEAQIEQVRQLLDSMKAEMLNRRQTIQLRWQHNAERAVQAAEAEAKLRGMDAVRDSLEREAVSAERNVVRTEQLVKDGGMTQQQLEIARKQLAEVQSRLSDHRVERDRLAAELQGALNQRGLGNTVGTEDARLVIYDARDLKSRIPEITDFLAMLRNLGGGELPRTQVFTPGSGKGAADGTQEGGTGGEGSPNLIIVATVEQHAVIADVLKMLRGGKPANVVEQKE